MSCFLLSFCREQKAYDPPEDVEQEVRSAFTDAAPSHLLAQDWLNCPLTDSRLKYRVSLSLTFGTGFLMLLIPLSLLVQFLLLCASKFNHQVPNSDLYLMKTVGDVVHFYKTPIRGSMTYDHLIRIQNQDQLPENLHLLHDPVSYEPDSAFLGGIDAFPGNPSMRHSGIREMIKYPPVKQAYDWPDI